MPRSPETSRRRTALGQGLDALLPIEEPAGGSLTERDVTYLSIDVLVPNPHQPRRLFAQESLAELSDSIKEIGVIQPIIVRPTPDGKYEIVAGERRWRAAAMAGASTIPTIVRTYSDSESLEIALIENLQREDLNPIETAEAYQTLISRYSYTHDVLAKRIGKDRTSITNHLRLLRLPDSIKDDVRQDRISMGHARTLLAVEDLTVQLSLSRRIIKRRLSVRELESIVQNYRKKFFPPPAKTVGGDPELRNLERDLSRHLATRVVIRNNASGSGKLEISFHSRDELDRLLQHLGYGEDFA